MSSFFFYDLETSGTDPKTQRIMQFAGQRTDMDLKPLDDPVNLLVALTEEVLPEPQAVLITGITPQKSREQGCCEAEFLKVLHEQVFLSGTIMVGFNNIRFDDEFVRYALYRNLYDPYEWSWQDGRSRWDMLDVVRMTRALRPDGVEWPVSEAGAPVNRLELLAAANNLEHAAAHDALSDVQALIAMSRLIKARQPKLFEYLLGMRDKKALAGLVRLDDPRPFVYTSGRYPGSHQHTTVAYPLGPGGRPGTVLVYDLRRDPADWARPVAELKDIRFADYEKRHAEDFLPLPVKELAYNKVPAVAPLGVLDDAAQARLKLDLNLINQNLSKLIKTNLADKFAAVFEPAEFPRAGDVDARLYDGFWNDTDRAAMRAARALSASELTSLKPAFTDERLPELFLRYKARNFPQSLQAADQRAWEAYRSDRLRRELPAYAETLARLLAQARTTQTMFLLEELQLWAESIVPAGN